ncbi:MAG TPA: tetratricopeptide repeat protein, partial [Candidatus Methylacidiphilales bacterium]|nr:tetratricopeptide repeat protein [Candidatus Methylacidiphilales bacterium]
DLKASLPFFIISLTLGMATQLAGEWFAARYPHPPQEVPIGGLWSRIALGGLSASFYFSKFFWPWAPSPMYLQWKVDPPAPWQFLPWPVLGGVIYCCWKKRESWGRHVLLGLGYFFLFLAPFLGFHEISYMMFTWVMDHFLYIPMIGLIGLIVAGLDGVARQLPQAFRLWGAGAVAIVLSLLALETHTYAGIYASQETLNAYAIRLNPDTKLARNNLGRALLKRGSDAEAIKQFEETLRLDPGYADAHFNLGTAFMDTNQLPQAQAQFEETIRLDPTYADAYDNLGAVLLQMGHADEATKCFQQAIALADYAQPHNDLGNALVQAGRLEQGIAEYQKALALNPDVAQVHDNLGLAFIQEKRLPEAVQQFEMAAAINPHDDLAHAALEKLEPISK